MKKLFLCWLLSASAVFGAPKPLLSLSANHSTVLELPRGWPLFVTGTLFHSERLKKSIAAEPLIIAPPNGASWFESI